jgi:hypothetical protein
MRFCWHHWVWDAVRANSQGALYQTGYCPKCGKARLRWLSQ